MSEDFTNFVNSSRPRARLLTCIAHAPVRNARGVPESVGVSREKQAPRQATEAGCDELPDLGRFYSWRAPGLPTADRPLHITIKRAISAKCHVARHGKQESRS
jgi:hypothetical protein